MGKCSDPCTHIKTQKKLLLLKLPSSGHCSHLGGERVDRRSLVLCLSLSLYLSRCCSHLGSKKANGRSDLLLPHPSISVTAFQINRSLKRKPSIDYTNGSHTVTQNALITGGKRPQRTETCIFSHAHSRSTCHSMDFCTLRQHHDQHQYLLHMRSGLKLRSSMHEITECALVIHKGQKNEQFRPQKCFW